MKNFRLYLRMLTYLRPYTGILFLVVGLSFVIVTSESMSLWFTGSLVNSIFNPATQIAVKPQISLAHINEVLKYWTGLLIQRSNLYDSLKLVCLFVIVFFLTKNIFTYIKMLVMNQLNLLVIRDLRNQLHSHALRLPVTFYDRNRSGHIVSLSLNDISAINFSMTSTFDKLLTDPLRLVFFVSALFIISVKLTLLSLIVIPIVAVVITEIGKTVRRRSKRTFESIEGLTSVLHESVSCIRIVKMFNMDEFEVNRFKKENDRFVRNNFRSAIFASLPGPLTESIGVLIAAILLWYGGKEVLGAKSFSGEDFVRFLAFLFMMFQPIKSLGGVNSTIQNGIAGAQRVFGLMDIPTEKLVMPLVATSVPSFESAIRFQDVRFAYPGTDAEVIKGVSFSIKKGQVVALVGSSGSGKSTLLDLLPRFYEIHSGAISIDGKDVRECDLVGLRHLFGIVSQETVLFNTTVFDNIAYGFERIDESKVIEAATAANAMEFIENMPQGLRTVVGERGVLLSGGQRQRLSIARALLRNPQILILDEATSALDTESEKLVQSAINNLMKNRTALVVAHRLSTIAHADHILVLENGCITEQGTHGDLLSLNKRYKYLYDIQFSVGAAAR
jgi:subfamily B ATP-binding cassette protein MsbA